MLGGFGVPGMLESCPVTVCRLALSVGASRHARAETAYGISVRWPSWWEPRPRVDDHRGRRPPLVGIATADDSSYGLSNVRL
jgi:hypothetical protein